jgi:hypothetical protein
MKRKRKAIPRETRQQIYELYGGRCAYCGREIASSEMQVDHVQAVYVGGKDDIANYRPACRQCNFYKSTMDVERLREQLSLIPGRLEKLLIFRLALTYGLVQITGKPVNFYFEERQLRRNDEADS